VPIPRSASLALDSLRTQPLRSALAIAGIVVGIVTVVLVATILAGVRNSVALLFREFGTDNIFAFHLSGDPYSPPSDEEARRKPLDPAFAEPLSRLSGSIRDVAVQLIVPTIVGGQPVVARAEGNESDRVFVEGVSPNFFEVTGAEFGAGRPSTEFENAARARVAVIGAGVARALYGEKPAVGRSLRLAGETYMVVGQAAPRRGTFFGENRQDNVIAVPLNTALRRFPDSDRTVLYIRAEPGQRELARGDAEVILRRLRGVASDRPSDFTLSTADQIIAQLDRLSGGVGLATLALAAVSLFIGGIGIANVMLISVTERTREIGVRRAVGARRDQVVRQFLTEAALLSAVGGVAGVVVAWVLGIFLRLLAPAFPAVPPPWAVVSGLAAAVAVGVLAGWLPARRASRLDPVESLRYE
jgi:putative ABC transport system permease protein